MKLHSRALTTMGPGGFLSFRCTQQTGDAAPSEYRQPVIRDSQEETSDKEPIN